MPSGFLLEKRGSSALAITSSWKCACIAPHPHSWYPLGSSLHDHVTGNVDMEAFWSCPLEVSLYMVERGICSELCSWKMAGVCSFTLNRGSHCRFWGVQESVQGIVVRVFGFLRNLDVCRTLEGLGVVLFEELVRIYPQRLPKKLSWLCYIPDISSTFGTDFPSS